MKEYKIAKGWAVFIYLAAPLLIGLFGWLLISLFQKGEFSTAAGWILIPFSIGMIVLMLLGMIETYRSRVIIQNDKVISIGTFSRRELLLDEIKGFTVGKEYVCIEPLDKSKKRLKISRYTERRYEIMHWLSDRYPDLEEQDTFDEEQEILNDPNIGWTREIREEKLSRARRTSKIINWVAGLTSVWGFFYPTPYHLAMLTAIVVPLIALIAVKLSDGLIKADEREGSAYPTVAYGFILPSCCLLLRALLDFDILDYSNLWPITIIISLAFLVLLFAKQKKFTFKKKSDYLIVPLLGLFVFMYSFGTVVHINCYYDHSEPKHYTAEILSKRISSGKTKTGYFKLSPWGNQKEADEVSVGKNLYKRLEVGDSVQIYLRNGKLSIPWFEVSDE